MHLNSPSIQIRWYDYGVVAFAAVIVLYLLVLA